MASISYSPATLWLCREEEVHFNFTSAANRRNPRHIPQLEHRELAPVEPFERHRGFPACNNEVTALLAVVKSCTKTKDLHRGIKVHDDISKRGLLKECSDALVTMYAKCGALSKAKGVLDLHHSSDVFSWTALIAAYARHGRSQDALSCFERMKCEGLTPDAVTFSCVLKACGSMQAIDKGEQIHDEIARKGLLGNDAVVGAALVDMYASCGALGKAERVLDELNSQDVVTWNALIRGYAQQGEGEQALRIFQRMQSEGFSPSEATFTCVLKACGAIKAIERGEQIHEEIVRQGLLRTSIMLDTALVDMYAKCGFLKKAHQLLEELPFRDVVCWSALIAGYAQQGQGQQALVCFELLQSEGLSPNAVTFASVLNACGNIGDIERGEQIHDEIARQGLLGTNVVLDTALVDMYAKCGALEKAHQLLEMLPPRNVASWNSLIAGYVQQGESELAVRCYEKMQGDGLSPDVMTFASVLKACGVKGALSIGEQIHDKVTRLGLLRNDMLLGSALVDMYAKCGALTKAHKMLDELPSRDAIAWNSLITGYAHFGHCQEALKCYEQMQRDGHTPDIVTFICILQACGNMKAIVQGDKIYDEIVRQGLLNASIVLGSALVDMYVKCGVLEKAEQVLKELPSRNAFSWNSLIVGYALHGQGEQAWSCYESMRAEGLSPDAVTYASILKACGIMGAVIKGEQIHDEIFKQGLLGSDLVLGTALLNMYAKCGALVKAQGVLEELWCQDVVLWNTVITAYVQQGQVEQALNCFERMQLEGYCPNAVTLSSVLNGCSHLGLVEEAHKHFIDMGTKYDIKPDLEHYSCMVDLFGRAGHLDKAVRVIQGMPFSDCSILCALLGACRTWKDVNVGKWAFQQALKIDKSDGAAYVLMADIYAAVGRQEDAATVEAMRLQVLKRAKEGPDFSWRTVE